MPSLNALRAFEAVARLKSISAAANELFVTPAAISQHVKALEAWAGEKLIKRNPQGIELSPLGANALNDFKLAFDQLGTAVQKLRIAAAPFEIRIAALPSVAQIWLSPRLPEIRKTMPDVSVSVSALENPPNLIREPFDLAIFYGTEELVANNIVINQDIIYPVCSPLIAERLKSVDDLKNEIFLHDTTWKQDWDIWLSNAVPGKIFSKSGPEFSLYSLALEECKNGAGVLIGHEDLVAEQVKNGDLVAPFGTRVNTGRNLEISTIKPLEAGSTLKTVISKLLNTNGNPA
ncbi:MAG: LysR family transcriptional regulator [Rhizobiaceae bacterium]